MDNNRKKNGLIRALGRLGRRVKFLQKPLTVLVVLGAGLMGVHSLWCLFLVPLFAWHLVGVWRRDGRALDPMLPLLVISTFLLAVLYAIPWYFELALRAKYGC